MSFYPRQTAYGQRLQAADAVVVGAGQVAHYKLTAPPLGVTTAVHAAIAQPSSGTTVVTTAITNPTYARNLTITGNQATCTGNVVIAGTDMNDAAITSTIAASGTATVVGTKAFKTVTSITIPTRGAASDSIAIGTGALLGIPHKLPYNTVLSAALAGVREATAPTVTVSATVLELNTFTLNSALNAGQVDIEYVVPSGGQ